MNDKNTFTGLYFGALPDLRDLVAYLLEEEGEKMSTIQPLGCRELLFTESRVLLSPCLENGSQAFMICKETVLECSKFKGLMMRLKFKVVKQVDVNNQLFQYCLAFTLTQKLAPLWNKAGEYFIQGHDFLECTSKVNAVSIDVNVTDRLCIGLKAFNLKLHLAMADHFCSSPNILQSFLTQRNFTIRQDSIQDDLCYVLPSLKKARVVGISHEIPPDSPFNSYEDLRKHWKLMYGYRLPSNESMFYNVRFFGSKIFTYPSSCIHSNYPQLSLRCDQQAIFQVFLQDVQNRIPFICESPLRLTSSALYSSSKLHSALNDNQSSLTRLPPQLKQCNPFVFSQMKQTKKVSSPNRSGADSLNVSASVSKYPATSKPNGSRFIPTFTKRMPSKPQVERKTKEHPAPKVCPVFKTKSVPFKEVTDTSINLTLGTSSFSSSTHLGVHQNLVTLQQNETLSSLTNNHTRKLPDSRPGLTLARSALFKKSRPSIPGIPGNSIDTPNRDKTPNSTCMGTNSGTLFDGFMTDANYKVTEKRLVSPRLYEVHDNVPNTENMLGNDSGSTMYRVSSEKFPGTSNKRQNSLNEGDTVKVKKPRAKPKVQEDVDIRQLALNNQLKKVNTITLVDWLSKQNVTVRQKDKKVELMEKVMNIIKSNAHES